uniref:Uncharacterized protein n=1 Tax=Panstrongylus lignarius TaxID=156445 RepID=A0A224XQS6_9HEMI
MPSSLLIASMSVGINSGHCRGQSYLAILDVKIAKCLAICLIGSPKLEMRLCRIAIFSFSGIAFGADGLQYLSTPFLKYNTASNLTSTSKEVLQNTSFSIV